VQAAVAIVYLLILAQYIASIVFCARYTQHRGRGAGLGVIIGFLFGWLGLLGLALFMHGDPVPNYALHGTTSAAPSMTAKLERLAELRRKGALTAEEYESEKRKLFAS
jgi:hypothetical protein